MVGGWNTGGNLNSFSVGEEGQAKPKKASMYKGTNQSSWRIWACDALWFYGGLTFGFVFWGKRLGVAFCHISGVVFS